MARLKTVQSRLEAAPSRLAGTPRVRERRLNGRRLQARRLAVWAHNPHCAACGELTRYPDGFHLDHIVALGNGGQDTAENSQCLCIACHRAKTRTDIQTFHRGS